MSDAAAPRTNFLIVFTIWGAGLGAAAQFAKISVIFAPMARDYGGAAATSWLVSVVGIVGLIFGTTAGLLVVRLGPRRVLVGGLMLGAALSAFQAGMPGYGWMLASRVAEGASQLAIVVAGPVLIAEVTAPRHNGFAMSLWASFFGVSFAASALIAPVLVAAFGIAGLFAAHAAYMAVFAALLWPMLPADHSADRPAAAPWPRPREGLLAQHLAIYRSPFVAAPAAGFVFYTLMFVALVTLMPLQMPPALHGWVSEGMPLIAIAVSLTLGVQILRWLSAVRLVQLGFALAAVAALSLWLVWGEGAAMTVALLALAGSLGLVQGGSFAAIAELNRTSEDRARAAGAIAQLGNLGTATGTPLLTALIAGQAATGVLVFSVPLCLGGLAAHQWMAWRRTRGH
ncbi:hypothetical protein U879_14700 [Defluviimonas sp. 20V17]|uniref:MFS transporter n=1 Tax=Allgaiera indica TaxID=765699 RepID=A0AAN4ZZL0_9RHOB|nr:MFS transporter [Allgaiera indica]KDB02924.1 hypothetical protein U879_14700 [Defluviimonas sp. 20V17]GHE01474.1 MFS transporter [Allgaiera indica]SDW87423.1 Predicted arabinose efflux permease, MFS family [Allgaiera indica]